MAKFGTFLRQLGPGVITGAANDDPSCIVTYSIAGATLGYATLWTSLYLLPLVMVVQWMCAKLGMVSGRGLAGDLRVYFPKWVLLMTCGGLVLANVVTLGADLGGMAEVTQMVTGISSLVWVPLYAVGITAMLFFLSYWEMERVLKWLALVLFAYVLSGFMAGPNWGAAFQRTLVPEVQMTSSYIYVMVAILGATVSPYFLFWQASLQVEEEYALGRKTVKERKGATRSDLQRSQVDVMTGSFISKLITFFITLTAAATLFTHGQHEIGSPKDAAAALEPIAGKAAAWVFAAGIIGTGLLSIPTLAGSTAYGVAETARWRSSLHEPPKFAPRFYFTMALAMSVGMGLIYAGIPVVKMLFWASILNGILAPWVIGLIVLLTSSERVMGSRRNGRWLRWVGWVTATITGMAAITLLLTLL